MKNTHSLKQVATVIILAAALIVSGPMAAFGRADRDQEKGKGKGRQQEKSDRREQKQQDRGDRGSRRQQGDSDRNSRRQQQRSDGDSRQRRSDSESRRQQRDSDRNSRRQQQQSDGDSRRQQARSDSESRRQQIMSDWNSRRRQQRSDRESRQQQARSDRQSRPQQQQTWNVWRGRENAERGRRGGDDNRRGRRQDGRGNRRVEYLGSPSRQLFGNIFNVGRPSWSYSRNDNKAEKRWLKDQRQAQRRYENDQRRAARNYSVPSGNAYYGNNYYSNGYGQGVGSDWKDQILRLVIANVIGNRIGGGEQYLNSAQYSPVYQNQPFYNGYRQAGYAGVPQYADNYYDPTGYQPDYGNGGGLLDGNFLSGDLLGSLPIAELIDQYTGGGGFASELLGNFVTQGYDQGFDAGQSARQNGYSDEYYHDPYSYEGGIRDPYSATLGESRRCLSDGYEIGYRDALNGQTGYDPQSDGQADLVSLLLSNVLSNV